MSAPLPSGLLDKLEAVVGPAGLVTEAADLPPYTVERRGRFEGNTPAVVRPASTEQVAAVVRLCAEAGVPMVPQGGNTGLVSGSLADGEIIISLGRLNKVRAVDVENFTLTADAGCILADIQAAASEHDRLFPLSLGAEGSCQIGGNIATNAGGTAVLRYGNMRELTLGLEVVLPDGRVWDGLRGLRKDNTGYDLKHLFIGAEGTLGIVTGAVLKLFPLPRAHQTAFAALSGLDTVLALLADLRQGSGDTVTAFELIPETLLGFAAKHITGLVRPIETRADYYALIELSSPDRDEHDQLADLLAAALDSDQITDATIARSEAQRQQLWRIREAIVEAQPHEGASIKNDVAVPVSRVPELIERGIAAVSAACPGIRPVPFGHVGDGNLHFNLTQPVGADPAAYVARWDELTGIINQIVDQLDGSFSAEHGIGLIKKKDLRRYRSPVEIDLMRTVKQTLDPRNLMNPGKVVSPSGQSGRARSSPDASRI